ncbi:ABC transporter permease [Proteiniclasticum sp. QWL-01]|uniref:ABC transporter permease n=1 Tax=Proteiniclasticum sp. QWL-01 TaxID=3036945 RepID=UPI0024114F59|nr:ABC transporter permease [Proteiniclasticum sp. QWL-01]WFF74389.1 ABC transporter permease [Proteiniclasticum sp. QWL-01]
MSETNKKAAANTTAAGLPETRKKKKSQLKEIWGRLKKNRLAVAGLFIIVMLILVAIFADVIAPYSYDKQSLKDAFQSPSAAHWFGTDEFGRDIFSRVVYGSRISFQVGFIAVSIAVVIGGVLGAVAGYYGGMTDNIIMRMMDVALAIPQILLAIAIVAALGPSLTNLMIAVGFSSIPGYARIVRASVLSIKGQEFVEAARAAGSGNARIIFKHIIPNVLAPIIVQATLGVALAILTAAGLSFIGLGIAPPTPEWGSMLSGGRGYIRDYSYMTLFPGLAIVMTILALNVLGDGLRDALDPKLKN